MQLVGKKVIVVGGSSGIGLATAELAHSEGADVIIAARNEQRLEAVASKLKLSAVTADSPATRASPICSSAAGRSITSWSPRRSFAVGR
jgi:NAD(P)-dependent dehydrogenase (short-subunit alcohol dehydrogenase family)